MKYLFAHVPHQDIEMFGTDSLFEFEGDYFFNQLEIGTNPGGMEDFTISDTCGRSIPLSVDSIDVLIEVLQDVKASLQTIQDGEAMQEAMFDNTFPQVFY
jgi:hypothetical protein